MRITCCVLLHADVMMLAGRETRKGSAAFYADRLSQALVRAPRCTARRGALSGGRGTLSESLCVARLRGGADCPLFAFKGGFGGDWHC